MLINRFNPYRDFNKVSKNMELFNRLFNVIEKDEEILLLNKDSITI